MAWLMVMRLAAVNNDLRRAAFLLRRLRGFAVENEFGCAINVEAGAE
jgi:hypothetical protein